MDDLFPVFLNLKNKKALIVGLGAVAERKARSLFLAGAQIKAVGLELKSEGLKDFAEIEERAYLPSDCSDVFIAVAATDSKELNRLLCLEWDRQNIIANNASSRQAENAFFTLHKNIGNCMVAVCGKGNPAAARNFLGKIERLL